MDLFQFSQTEVAKIFSHLFKAADGRLLLLRVALLDDEEKQSPEEDDIFDFHFKTFFAIFASNLKHFLSWTSLFSFSTSTTTLVVNFCRFEQLTTKINCNGRAGANFAISRARFLQQSIETVLCLLNRSVSISYYLIKLNWFPAFPVTNVTSGCWRFFGRLSTDLLPLQRKP